MSQAATLRAPAGTKADRIQVGWVSVEICLLIALLVLFNVYPDWIGVYGSAVDPSSFVPVLATEFQVHMPWLNIWWGTSLLLAVSKLIYRRWTPALRWAEVGLRVYGFYVLIRLITGGPILDPTLGWDALRNVDGLRWLGNLASDPNIPLKALLGIAALPTAIGILQRLVWVARAAQQQEL